MTLDDYFHHITSLIIRFSFLYSFSLELDKRTPYIGLVRGNLYFIDGSALFFREFLNVESEIVRLMYVYHYQDSDGKLIFRYDNAPHYPQLESFPHHKHFGSNVISSDPVDSLVVLHEIQNRFRSNS